VVICTIFIKGSNHAQAQSQMLIYHTDEFCQESQLFDFLSETPVPVADLTDDVIVLVNRASSPGQEAAHDSKFKFMRAAIGDAGRKVFEKRFTGSGRLGPVHAYNESQGLNHEYRNSWFGFLEDIIEEAIRLCFPGQMLSVLMLTPDRFARPQYFHPHNPRSWSLSNADYKQLDDWLAARFGSHRRRFRLLICFTGSPGQCRGFQSQLGMRYSGKHNGRPKGSRNKKSRVPILTPRQKTAFRDMLHAEIPHLVDELKLNGTQCYNHFKSIYGYVPAIRETICRWVAKHRGKPGESGRPATNKRAMDVANVIETESTIVKKECVILNHCYKRSSGRHPALLRLKRIQNSSKPLIQQRDNTCVPFFLYSRCRQREDEPP